MIAFYHLISTFFWSKKLVPAHTKGTESFRAISFADYDGKEKGNLYFIGFGVSKYRDKRLNLKYADQDILKQWEVFKKMEGNAYDKVIGFPFTNDEVTIENIESMKEILKKVSTDDTVILSISGHGAHERKEIDQNETYYFITHKTDITNLDKTAVKFELLESILQGTTKSPLKARKKLFLMDTCESGELDDDTKKNLAGVVRKSGKKGIHFRKIKNDMEPVISNSGKKNKFKSRPYIFEKDRFIHNDLFRRTGAIVFSSSKGGELSEEHDGINNGVFSYTLITALTKSNAADKDGDGIVTMEELKKFVMKYVPKQTENRQHPTVDRDNLSIKISFPIIK